MCDSLSATHSFGTRQHSVTPTSKFSNSVILIANLRKLRITLLECPRIYTLQQSFVKIGRLVKKMWTFTCTNKQYGNGLLLLLSGTLVLKLSSQPTRKNNYLENKFVVHCRSARKRMNTFVSKCRIASR